MELLSEALIINAFNSIEGINFFHLMDHRQGLGLRDSSLSMTNATGIDYAGYQVMLCDMVFVKWYATAGRPYGVLVEVLFYFYFYIYVAVTVAQICTVYLPSSS